MRCNCCQSSEVKKMGEMKFSADSLRSKLSQDALIALESLNRAPWVFHHGLQLRWRSDGQWWHVDRFGFATSDTTLDCIQHRPEFLERAERAFELLEQLGLAETMDASCCPGKSCHFNGRHLYMATALGCDVLGTGRKVPVETERCAPKPVGVLTDADLRCKPDEYKTIVAAIESGWRSVFRILPKAFRYGRQAS